MAKHLDAAYLSRPERLAALKDSGLLRHDVAGRLDVLCESATHLLKAPIAEVNVLDGVNQTSVGKWPHTGTRVKPVEDTGCREVVLARAPIVINNTLLHPVMCMIPVVTVIGVRAYLGVPVLFDGEVIGAFCAADYVVREWTVWDIAGLQGLARLAGLSVGDDD